MSRDSGGHFSALVNTFNVGIRDTVAGRLQDITLRIDELDAAIGRNESLLRDTQTLWTAYGNDAADE